MRDTASTPTALAAAAPPATSPIIYPALREFERTSLLVRESGADPWLVRHDGTYFYTQTIGKALAIWSADSIEGLKTASPREVWSPGPEHTMCSKNLWAPELHLIDGRWYLYFAADDGRNERHRLYVLESNEGPLGNYTFKGKLAPEGDDCWAIDGTPFEYAGQWYFTWSGWPGATNGVQNLYISRMRNPWSLDGPRVLISTPTFAWESWINEGPQVVQRDGALHIVFSANRSWTDHYKLGLLTLDGADPLSPAAWRKSRRPIFASRRHADEHVIAPGHCCLFEDEGEQLLLYHVAKHKGSGWVRQVRAQRWSWDADLRPRLGTPLPLRANCRRFLESGGGRLIYPAFDGEAGKLE